MENLIFERKLEELLKDLLTHFREYYRYWHEAAPPKAPEPDRGAKAPLSGEARKRWNALKAWRSAEARTQSVAAFLVFGNRTLRELAEKAPRTLEEVAEIHGVGPRKLEQYGAEVLKVLGQGAGKAPLKKSPASDFSN